MSNKPPLRAAFLVFAPGGGLKLMGREMKSTEVSLQYKTSGGLHVERTTQSVDLHGAVEEIVDGLDTRRGVLLSSNYDYPGRYTRWDLGFVDPPLALASTGRTFEIRALNPRGEILIAPIAEALGSLEALDSLKADGHAVHGTVRVPHKRFAEEERSRQPSVFSVLRRLQELFASGEDEHLGLYGAFGYDLTFQFEKISLRRERSPEQRDLVLYLPDNLVVVDHRRGVAERHCYEFGVGKQSSVGLPRSGERSVYEPDNSVVSSCDHAPGEYAAAVERARRAFKAGDLFEVVLSQTFVEPCSTLPSEIFRRLRKSNPAPYALLLNLGEGELLVGASPEMYVRVENRRVETCPISGTIARGHNAVEDAERIRELLDSRKDESELTMCTDVDRNDKSRICEPGSVRVIGRRQIELYSRLIHTVDHVEGTLRPGYDALDAFLTHTWAVTVTGAPKPAAIQRVEDEEKSPRAWYGGAIGRIGFNGDMNTGLTLRTVHLCNGSARVRAGATLLFDSEPEAEERETRVKASAFLDAIRGVQRPASKVEVAGHSLGKRVLLVDHEDSFVHTLANYIRQAGTEVTTLRAGFDFQELEAFAPDLVVLSPGPGEPKDFHVSETIGQLVARKIPIFGVCLGLQGIVEHFGGKLGVLDYPMHGKPSTILNVGGRVLRGLPPQFTAARYHSLYALPGHVPADLEVCARSEDGVVMAVEHRHLPIAAVQFHPESILTLHGDVGLRLLRNAVERLTARDW